MYDNKNEGGRPFVGQPAFTLCKLPPPNSIVLVAGNSKSHIWGKILPNTPLEKATTEKLYKQQTLKS